MGMMDMNKGKAGKPPRLFPAKGKVNTSNDASEGDSYGKAPSPPIGSKPSGSMMEAAKAGSKD